MLLMDVCRQSTRVPVADQMKRDRLFALLVVSTVNSGSSSDCCDLSFVTYLSLSTAALHNLHNFAACIISIFYATRAFEYCRV